MQTAPTSSKKEISRLAYNNKVLLDVLPDMILIIKDDFLIEHMNSSAIAKFGDRRGLKCHKIIAGLDVPCETGNCPFDCQNPDQLHNQFFERKLTDRFFIGCCYVPFKGYRSDNLALLIMRDITEKKIHEMELEKYSKNIEKVLNEKIATLKESEEERQQLYQEVNYLKKEAERFAGREKMIGESKPIRALREKIHQVAASDATI